MEPNPSLGKYLHSLRSAGKMVFLLTNSPYHFVDVGLKFILGKYVSEHQLQSWRQLFDVVIVSAKKPSFFDRAASFRKLDINSGMLSFEPVNKFTAGEIYTEGSLQEFTRLSGKTGHNVLYMGDHIFSDLIRPSKAAMWKTAAIIKEIGYETERMSSPEFFYNLTRSLQCERLISIGQRLHDTESKNEVQKLKLQREYFRKILKIMFNAYFGSVFRTASHRTSFFSELCRHTDVYTASIDNFMHYPLDYCFYVEREYFPHEKRPPAT